MAKNKKNIPVCLVTTGMAISMVASSTLEVMAYSNSFIREASVESQKELDYIHLSDIGYVQNMSSVGWDSIKKDTNINGGKITLNVEDGETVEFDKGYGAHATSTLVFDVSQYSQTYTRFTTYVGVDKCQGDRGNGVKCTVSISNDGQNWVEVATTGTLKGNTNSAFIDVDITGAKYLKLYAYDNGSNGNDHSVYGMPRIMKKSYDVSNEYIGGIKKVEQYDELIKRHSIDEEITGEYEKLLLQRTFVKRAGFYTIQNVAKMGKKYEDAISWLINDVEALKLYVTGGEVENGGSYKKSLMALADLYEKYKSDFNDSTNGDLYLKMAISISLSHAIDVKFWIGNNSVLRASDPCERYRIYKENYNNGLMAKGGNPELFRNLPVEHMRWVMDSKIDNEEINWLINHSLKKKEQGANFLDAYTYINYTFDYKYDRPELYDQNMFDKWNQKYDIDELTGYGTPGLYRLWMIFEEGSVCGGLAKTYTNLSEVFGMPGIVLNQPGHAAALSYRYNNQGEVIWSIQNDVSGWVESRTETGERMPLGWGSKPWRSTYFASYIVLSQKAFDNYDDLMKAMYYHYLADVYKGQPEKQIEIYEKALAIQDYNLDAIEGLFNAYKAVGKTSADYLELAKRVSESLAFFPLPYYDVMRLIEPYVTDDTDRAVFDMYRNKTLQRASIATTADTRQADVCKTMAKHLLGQNQTELATFSFDGQNAGKIKLNDKYENSSLRWEYSLDGWQTKKSTDAKEILLTKEELESINPENDIQISLVGTSEIYTIDITKPASPTGLYVNDLENQFRGQNMPLEYSDDNGATWHNYDNENTRLTGNRTVLLRTRATKTKMPSDYTTYRFTEDNQPDERTYIQLKNVRLHSYSSQQNNSGAAAANMIDGNGNTGWHNTWNGEENKFYTVEFDKVRYISSIEYLPSGHNGILRSADIYTSMDGQNWTKSGEVRNLPNNYDKKTLNLYESTPAKYVKIQAVNTYGSPNDVFFTGKMLNFFEDTTKIYDPIATFSFDGENANKLVLAPKYSTGSTIKWEYSLDGGETKKTVTSSSVSLTDEELSKLNTTDDILVSIVGDDRVDRIQITKQQAPTGFRINDLENQFLKVEKKKLRNLEYSTDNGLTWQEYDPENTRVTADGVVKFRYARHENKIESDAVDYTFTADNQPNTRKYVPIKHISLHAYSSQQNDSNEAAKNMLDGDINTYWHNDWDGEADKYYTVEFDRPRYITSIDYLPYSGPNGKFRDVDIYTSMDGTNWTKSGSVTGLLNDMTTKTLDLTNPTLTKYIKLDLVNTHGHRQDAFAAGSMLNFYEDTTKEPPVTVTYSEKELTNEDVTVTFGVPQGYTVVGENTHTFEKNGTHTFEYRDTYGNVFTKEVEVSWIDKKAPVGQIEYSTTATTNKEVVATLTNLSEDVTLLGITTGSTTDSTTDTLDTTTGTILNATTGSTTASYVFTENGECSFIIKDKAGNISKIKAEVNWIDKVAPTADIVYDKKNKTNQNVTATLANISEDITVIGISSTSSTTTGSDIKTFDLTTNSSVTTGSYVFEENGECVFRIQDKAGNVSEIKAKVDWIDKVAPTAKIVYDINKLTNQNVTAKLTELSEEVEVLDTTNSTTTGSFVFTENGSHTFRIKDEAGNITEVVANVNWIDKEAPKASISYDITTLTNEDVTATLGGFSEKVTILDTTDQTTTASYVFKENGEHTFRIQDEAGNISEIKAEVNWIDKILPNASVVYNTTGKTNGEVVATLEGLSEEVTLLEIIEKNTSGETTTTKTVGTTMSTTSTASHTFRENGECIFKIQDKAGNTTEVSAKVNWIDKNIPGAEVSFDITEKTNKDVTATITKKDKDITITNNDGKNTYTFKENGTFVFEYVDEYGNKGQTAVTVDWIDKEAPVGQVEYSTTATTNKEVVATLKGLNEEVTLLEIIEKNTSGETTTTKTVGTTMSTISHTFTENGECTFKIQDEAGNISEIKAEVNWIDKVAPTADIQYSTTDKTNQDVVAKLVNLSEDITILDKTNLTLGSYVFSENGEYTFEIQDKAGNISEIKAKVDWINKEKPVLDVVYSTENSTSGTVTATLNTVTTGKTITITNNDGNNEYTFTKNGEFTFEYVDDYGNEGSTIAKVDWITTEDTITTEPTIDTTTDTTITTKPTIDTTDSTVTTKPTVDTTPETIEPVVKVSYSTEKLTNKDVVATLEVSTDCTIIGDATHTFTENGEHIFKYQDKNGKEYSEVVKVDWIDKEKPKADVVYDINTLTNKDVVATLANFSEEVEILETTDSTTGSYVFRENGEHIFRIQDKAGNISEIVAKVDWIDKVAPTAQITYDILDKTNSNVVATLTNESEDIIVLNNNGSRNFVFNKNGEFTFEIQDKAGNKSQVKAEVNWIEETVEDIKPVVNVSYSTEELTNQDVVATLEVSTDCTIIGEATHTFTENGEHIFKYQDKNGKEYSEVVKVDWIDKEKPKADVVYDINTLTNKDVVATLANFSEEVEILETTDSTTGSYIFRENGEHTFRIQDKAGNISEIVAKVDWIDKVAPTAEITYDITDKTIDNVVAKLTNQSEDIMIENNHGSKYYVFTENGEFTFIIRDKAGNKSEIKAEVDWIIDEQTMEENIKETTEETVKVNYEITTSSTVGEEEKETVTVNLELPAGYTVLGRSSYTFTRNGVHVFRFIDDEGNIFSKTVTVDWLEDETTEDKPSVEEKPVVPTLPEEDNNSEEDGNISNEEDSEQDNTTDVDNSDDKVENTTEEYNKEEQIAQNTNEQSNNSLINNKLEVNDLVDEVINETTVSSLETTSSTTQSTTNTSVEMIENMVNNSDTNNQEDNIEVYNSTEETNENTSKDNVLTKEQIKAISTGVSGISLAGILAILFRRFFR